jgi:hypothetical protein
MPEHVRVPFTGCAGHAAHAPLQSIVPAGQLLQTPPLQFEPVGQTVVQLPQWFRSVAVSISQPSAGL